MTTGEIWGWIGGIVGSLIGLAGGIIGIRYGIKNTCGPRERVFVLKTTVLLLIAIGLVVVLSTFLPKAYGWIVFIPFTLLLVIGIPYSNRTQQRIRQKEAQNKPPEGTR